MPNSIQCQILVIQFLYNHLNRIFFCPTVVFLSLSFPLLVASFFSPIIFQFARSFFLISLYGWSYFPLLFSSILLFLIAAVQGQSWAKWWCVPEANLPNYVVPVQIYYKISIIWLKKGKDAWYIDIHCSNCWYGCIRHFSENKWKLLLI